MKKSIYKAIIKQQKGHIEVLEKLIEAERQMRLKIQEELMKGKSKARPK